MASAREIKNRISSVSDTKKITNAMYLIASTKLSKCRRDLENTRPYFNALKEEVKRIFRVDEDIDSPYFYKRGTDMLHDGVYGILVISADKGLAGAYNSNVLKTVTSLINEHPDYKIYCVGSVGRNYFNSRNIPIVSDFSYSAKNPSIKTAKAISDALISDYLGKKIDKLYIVYTDMKNSLEREVITNRLLPFHRKHFESSKEERPIYHKFEYYPSLGNVLNNVMPGLLCGYIYSALVDSFCAEQNERMSAMDSSNRNADKLLSELSIEYNRVRQAAITQEITEVSAGAKAMKNKRKKKLEKKGIK